MMRRELFIFPAHLPAFPAKNGFVRPPVFYMEMTVWLPTVCLLLINRRVQCLVQKVVNFAYSCTYRVREGGRQGIFNYFARVLHKFDAEAGLMTLNSIKRTPIRTFRELNAHIHDGSSHQRVLKVLNSRARVSHERFRAL